MTLTLVVETAGRVKLRCFAFCIPPGPVISNKGYRVVSVSRGQLHAKRTGRLVRFDDQKLVKQALHGSIKTRRRFSSVMVLYCVTYPLLLFRSPLVCSVLNDVFEPRLYSDNLKLKCEGERVWI